jgi:dihydrolipoamide dehydrogenase
MAEHEHDLVIIGGGPAGYVSAIRAAQLGLNTACIELDSALGGTCLRIGCIPSKALLESSERFVEIRDHAKSHGIVVSDAQVDLPAMMKRKDGIVRTLTKGIDGLFKKYGVTRYFGRGRIDGPGKVTVEGEKSATVACKHILIATGSVSSPLKGVELDGDRIGTSTEALSYPEVPKHLVVIGAGAIGLEMGSVWNRLGAQVTVLEYLDHILPGMDAEISKEAHKIFKKQGIEFQLGARVTGARADKKGCVVEVEGAESIRCDRVLLSVGRRPNTEGLGLENVNVTTDKAGRIAVDEYWQTGEPGIYAVGDVIRGPMLAHKAEEEGVACVERIATGYGHINYDAIPAVVYTHPEVAAVGKTEEDLKSAGIPYKSGVFPYMANGRAKALGSTEGKVKILAHADTDRVLGVHIVGARAGDLIAEAAMAIEFSASSEDIARTSHAHPSLAEIVKQAAWATFAQPTQS